MTKNRHFVRLPVESLRSLEKEKKMDFQTLKRVKSLQGLSRFQIAELKKQAEQGKGILSGLTRFEIAEVVNSYEKEREKRCRGLYL